MLMSPRDEAGKRRLAEPSRDRIESKVEYKYDELQPEDKKCEGVCASGLDGERDV